MRDPAQAHYRTGLMQEATGRYIVDGHSSDVADLATPLRERFGDLRTSSEVTPRLACPWGTRPTR